MKDAEELRAAVKSIRERAGLTVRSMADLLNMSPSGYSHYEQRIKSKSLPPQVAGQIAEVVASRGVPREDVYNLVIIDEKESGQPYRLANKEEMAPIGDALVSIYDIEAQGGIGMVPSAYEAVVDQLAFPPGYLRSITSTPTGKLAIIGVVGASMQPTLNHGDIVMVDMTKTDIDFDGMFVIRIGEALKVKRVSWGPRRQSIVIRSDNANKIQFPDEEYFESDDVAVIGRVVWVGAKQP
ncbi:S24 family peptidase [Pseudooceanicola sp. C21-150M6]|uniref:S24 family peptidase n=1 Tax=Pseudooceanicola sp. C21-150M6 TaxID=3434355 RepID=UPI003D7F9077